MRSFPRRRNRSTSFASAGVGKLFWCTDAIAISSPGRSGLTTIAASIGRGARGGGHGVLGDDGARRSQIPRRVENVAARDGPAGAGGVEAVALGEEVLERALRRPELASRRPVARPERRAAAVADAGVGDR